MDKIIYLDYNATAPLRPGVVEAMQQVMHLPLNASSVHSAGRQAKKIVEDTRRTLAGFLNCWPQEIIWCDSATEANNTVLRQFGEGACLVSSMEHSSVLNALKNPETIPATEAGAVDLQWLEARLNQPNKPSLVSVMLANNETGALQPVKEVVALARRYNILTHTDAMQALGKIPIDFSSLGVDYMTIGFHKNGGPVGVSGLVVKNGTPFKPFIRGGGQEFNRRAGTENVAAIAGVDALLACWSFEEIKRLKGWMENLEASLSPDVSVVAATSNRLGNTSCIINPSISQEVQLMRLDLAGICIGAGSACTSGKIEPSHVLTAMGLPEQLASRAIRISGGWNTSQKDCDAFVKAYNAMSDQQPLQKHG